MLDTHANAVTPRAASPAGSARAHAPTQHTQLVPAALPFDRQADESAARSVSAHRTSDAAPDLPRDVLLWRARVAREELAGFRAMVAGLGTPLDLPYTDREADREAAARELAALRAMVASLAEQLAECYALQEQPVRLAGRAPADLVDAPVRTTSGEPGSGR